MFGPDSLKSISARFDIPMPWVLLRVIGAVIATCIYLELGPEWLWGSKTGHVVFYDLAIPIVTIFIFAAFLLPLLTDYGLMEFVGTVSRKVFQKIFGLPGRSCIDAMASWMASMSIWFLKGFSIKPAAPIFKASATIGMSP